MADSIGCFDGSSHSWDRSYIERLGIDEDFFPDVVCPSCICGTVRDEKVSSLMQNRDVPIGVAIGDNQASFIGSVRDFYLTLLVNIGTGSQISFAVESIDELSKTQKIDGYDVVVRPFIEGGYIVAGNALSGGGSYAALYNFFRKAGSQLFGINDFKNLWDRMENLAAAVQKRSRSHERLVVNPLFAGRRSNPEERGRIEGISLGNFIPEVIIFETLRGIATVLKDMIDERIIEKITRIVGSGNGLRKNSVLRNILSDQFKQRVYVPRYTEEAAIGAALCGAVAAGIYRNMGEANEVIRYL
jgi:sedoheptulokinase